MTRTIAGRAITRTGVLAAVAWLVAAIIIVAFMLQARATAQAGIQGNAQAIALKPDQMPRRPTVQPTSLTSSVTVTNRLTSSQVFVVRITPISVTKGTLADFRIADPQEVIAVTPYYVTYTVGYVGGDVITSDPNVALRPVPGKLKEPMVPNGMTGWNQSTCQRPPLSARFAFGKGTLLTRCDVIWVRNEERFTHLQLRYREAFDRNADIRWPLP